MDSTQQWDDDEIIERYRVAFGKNPDVHHMAFLCVMRDEALAELAALRQELIDALDSCITRGNVLLYEDEVYRARYKALTGHDHVDEWEESEAADAD